MEAETEYWDLYNMNGKFIMRVRRGSCEIPPWLYHEAVEIIPTDKAGHILLTRRSLEKRKGGGMYEFPAGSVISGESPQAAARRELREETGLVPEKLYKLEEVVVPGLKRIIFLAHIPDLLEQTVTLQEGETMDYRIVTVDEWLKIIVSSKYDLNRCKIYTPKLYRLIRSMVGTADDREEPQEPQLKLVPTDGRLVGSRSGTSGQAWYEEEFDEADDYDPYEETEESEP